MEALSLLLEVSIGAGLGYAFVLAVQGLFARRLLAQLHVANVALGAAALVYIGFALWHPPARAHWLPLEAAGLIAYGMMAVFSSTSRSPFLAAAGWAAHCAWDMGVHAVHWPAHGALPSDGAPHVPSWYPGFCMGFDLILAAWLCLGLAPPLLRQLKRME